MIKRKKFWLLIFSGIVLILVGFLWFSTKFYPTQTGEWASNKPDNFSEEKIPDFGWQGDQFWTAVDYPGEQDACLDITLKNSSGIQNPTLTAFQSPRAVGYELAGDFNTFVQEQSQATTTENISQDKPYLLNHLADNIVREGKDLFFLGTGEKFLIPTKSIFTAYFPSLDLPEPIAQDTQLTYSNKLVNFPEGMLLSDGKGVFIMSNRKLALIRSPEIFESLGYKWEDVRQMSKTDQTFNPYLSGNLIDFDAANPNGTILKDGDKMVLVWKEKLYSLTEAEKTKYFPTTPAVEVKKQELRTNCENKKEKVTCCVYDFDPRLNAPLNYPFANTLYWNLEKVAPKAAVSRIDWHSTVTVNQENTLHRLRSFKNFVLYASGILK